MTIADELCGPYVCIFPPPAGYRTGERWTCLDCGTTYVRRRRRPERFWRTWFAPDGHWDLPFRTRLRDMLT